MSDYEVTFDLQQTSIEATFEINAAVTPALEDLTDIDIDSPTNGQKLTYNSTTGKWENVTGQAWGSMTGSIANQTDLNSALNSKQSTLVSGTNIKTINGNSILGSGNIVIQGGGISNWGEITGNIEDQADLQEALDEKVTANPNITGRTRTKITYDSKGLVTAGENLIAADIPAIPLSKIEDVTASFTEVNHLTGISSNVQNQIDGKQDTITDLANIRTNATAGKNASDTISGYGNIVTHNVSEFATEAQGDLADAAVQPGEGVSLLDNDMGYITADYHDPAKQNKLTAGANIQMNGNTISAIDTTYSAGEGISISDSGVITNTRVSAEWGNITGSIGRQADLNSKLAEKLNANTPIEAGTKTKISYDENGLVISGSNLTEADIPTVHLEKVSDVVASATEVNYMQGVTSGVQGQLDTKADDSEVVHKTGTETIKGSKTFRDTIHGLIDSATKATQDEDGNVIIETYSTKEELEEAEEILGASLAYSEPTLTLKNPDGTVISSTTINVTPQTDNQTIVFQNNKLQANGVHTKDGNIKFDWIGTEDDYYDAWDRGEIDPTWFCFITDDYQPMQIYEGGGGGTEDVYTKAEVNYLLSLKQDKLTAGDNITIINNIISSTGGGGGGPVTPNFELITITPTTQTVAYGSDFTLSYTYNSYKSLSASATYSVNSAQVGLKVISTNGQVDFELGSYLQEGTNYVEVAVTDVYGFTMTLTYEITAVSISIESSFDSSQFYESDVTFRYVPYGNVSKTVHFVLDGTDTTEVVTTSGRQLSKLFSNLTYGTHKLRVYMTAQVGNTLLTSNELYYEIMYVGGTATGPIIASEFTGTTFKQGEIVSIPFTVYTPNLLTSDVSVYVDNVLVSTMTVDRTRQTWSKNITTVGSVAIKFVSGTAERTFTITVTRVDIDVEPVTENLALYLDAVGRTNNDTDRDQWVYGDLRCTLSGFNFVTNGWINNALVISNGASLTVPLQIFQQDFRPTGKTIEIEFATSNISDYDSIVGSCLSGNRGFQIGVQNAFLRSEQSEVKARFKEDEHIRLTFVVEPLSSNRLIYTFLNGILSGIVQYPSDDDFSQITPVNMTFGSSTADIHIYKMRVYDSYLLATDVLNNWIADTNDINEKISRYTRNNIYDAYGRIVLNNILNQVPVMTITGELPPSKGNKKKVKINYQNLQDPTRDFTMRDVTIDIQGTSSQYYPKKNYKISKLPTAYSLRSTSVAEKVFTLKADYMESSHAHNTGLGKYVGTLYTDTTPPQAAASNIRTTIDGFPIAIFYKEQESSTPSYFGVYNFNNDKESNDTWGFADGCESWEVCNNTSSRCLFKSDDFTDLEAVLTDFEARYPADYTDVTNLHALVTWIVSCDSEKATGNPITPVTIGDVTFDHDTALYRIAKFKDECEDHFNLNYLLTYYITGEFFGMVDSFAKNLFLNLYRDGLWYPVFYDMDTQIGLNNEGVNEFNFNIEFHDQIGTSKVFNGESSALWNMVERAYGDELQALYQSLRADNKLTYDKTMNYYNTQQIAQICEAQYNEDAQFKYLDPLLEEGIATYLYTAQGSRIDHIKWWLSSRFKYMDSKYIASDYGSNYLTMRIYTPQTWQEVTPSAVITVTPYADQYVRIKYGSYTVGGRAEHDVPYVVNPPAGITFNDTETIIYGADKITSVGDLSPLYAGTIDVSKAVKLSELIIGHGGTYSNTNLKGLTVGNNTLLKKLDVRNCPNLTGALDVSGCTGIQEIDTSGTSLTSVKLAEAGSITKLILPNTITNLTVKNQNSITTFSCGNAMTTIVLENTNLNSQQIFANSNPQKVRFVGVTWTITGFTVLDRVYSLLGVDEHGYNVDHGVLTGTVNISGVKVSELDPYKVKFPGVTFVVVDPVAEEYIRTDEGWIITENTGLPLIYTGEDS